MREVKLSSKNQIAIAREVREVLGVKAGDRLLVVPRGNTVILLHKPKNYAKAVAGTYGAENLPVHFFRFKNGFSSSFSRSFLDVKQIVL